MADHNAGESGADINSQRAKVDEYRKWMQQQQRTLETTGAGTNEIARRIEQSESTSAHNQNSGDESQMSAYMRRNLGRKSTSPLNQGRKMNHNNDDENNNNSPNEDNNNNNNNRNGNGGGGGYYSNSNARRNANNNNFNNNGSPRQNDGEKPNWINTKVGSTNTKSAISAEQLAKFNPPPPSDDGGYQNDPLNVFSRSTLWQKRKHQKMAEARDLKEQVMDMECTFAPATHTENFFSDSRERDRGSSVLAQDQKTFGGYHVTGVKSFVTRQEKARAELSFKESRLKTRPEFSWRNEATVPEPFELGRRREHRIKSLKQPFTAAPGAVQQAMRGVPVSSSRGNMFAQVEGVMPRGIFSGVTAGEIVDFATLRSGGEQSPASDRR